MKTQAITHIVGTVYVSDLCQFPTLRDLAGLAVVGLRDTVDRLDVDFPDNGMEKPRRLKITVEMEDI